ncbi:TonB-dependent receptor domain-containing protein [Paracoccus versutus]|uniref:TonB-dependent receptor domain-containing protein n=1 Tax=Paracoccus versutus TaxID=34007 RepID=UPI000DF74EA7|nr:TonB-dependent receptor [Paracoccus versutus]RDD69891.1 TonB-dependent receptor [Paracoccus versutus]
MNGNTNQNPDDDAISEKARAIFLELNDRPSARRQAEALAWRRANPTHEAAWQQVATAWQSGEQFSHLAQSRAHELSGYLEKIDRLHRGKRRRKKQAVAGGIAACLAAAVLWIEQPHLLQDIAADHVAARAQPLSVALADGSTVLLDADTTLSFTMEHRNHDPRGSEWAGWPSVFSDGSLTHFPRGFSSAPWWASWSGKQDMALLRVDHDFGNGWTGNATLSAVKRIYVSEHMRFYGQPDPVTGLGLRPFAQKDKVQARQIALDAQASGPVQAFGREHVLNFGFHGGREWGRSDLYVPAGGQPVMGSVFDWDGGMARPDWLLESRTGWAVGTTQYAGYGSAKVSIADPLTAIVGARYTDWKSDDRHFTELTPFVGLVYDVTEDVSVYASYTSIFNPQSLKDRNGRYLDPVQGKSKEVGIKGAWLDDRLNASLSWFNTYQDNVATEDVGFFLPGGEQAYYGAKGVSAKGVELEISGEMRPGLNLFFGAATMKQRDANGEPTMTDQPSRTAKLFATWHLPGQWDRWTVGGGARWQNRTWTSVYPASGETTLHRSGYTVADAMVRYDINDRWSAQLNVNNLFDKTYFTNAGSIATYGEPRNAMLTLVSRF